MAYKITFTKRFVKNVKRLSAAERTQLKKKLELLMQDPLIRHFGQSGYREQQICLSSVSIWMFGSYGNTTETLSYCCWTSDTMIF